MKTSKKNSFIIECPYCGYKNNFTGDNWNDDLIDTEEDHKINCMECEKMMIVTVYADYTHSAEKADEDDND